jgi:hypothetical protein
MEPLQPKFLTSSENPDKTQIFITPLVGWNTADQFMLGIGLHNKSFIEKPFEWFIGPMYSFHREELTGIADFSYHIYPNRLRRITANFNVMKFAYDIPIDGYMVYSRYYPKLIFDLKPKRERVLWRHKLKIGVLHIEELYKGDGTPFVNANNTYGEFSAFSKVTGMRQTLTSEFDFTAHEDFNLATVTYHYKFRYNQRGNRFSARLFVGSFLNNETNSPIYNFRMDGQTGYLDYQKNQIFADRAGTHDVWKNQMNENHGAFKSPTSVGQSSKWIAAINIKMEAPMVVPIGVFADIGVAEQTEFMFNAGFTFRIWRDICEIYFPVVWSENIKQAYDANNTEYGERIRFTLNLPAMNPYKHMQNVGL